MEKDTPQPIEWQMGSYVINAALDCQTITIKAYSELNGKMFEASIGSKDLTEGDRAIFVDCDGIYTLMEECIIENRKVEFSDAGQLKFPYEVKSTKKHVERAVVLRLKEVEVGETQRLLMKIDKLERLNRLLEERVRQLEEKNKNFDEIAKHREKETQLETKINHLEENAKRGEDKEKLNEGKAKELEDKVRQLELKNGQLEEKNHHLEDTLRQLGASYREHEANNARQFLELSTPRFQKVPLQLDMGTASIGKASVNGVQITCDKNIGECHPFFLTKRLDDLHSFEVEVVTAGSHYIYAGIAADTLRNTANCYNNADSLTLLVYSSKTFLYSEGGTLILPVWPLQSGWKLRVNVDRLAHTVEWTVIYPVLLGSIKASIPAGMRNKSLFPVVHLYCHSKAVLKFM